MYVAAERCGSILISVATTSQSIAWLATTLACVWSCATMCATPLRAGRGASDYCWEEWWLVLRAGHVHKAVREVVQLKGYNGSQALSIFSQLNSRPESRYFLHPIQLFPLRLSTLDSAVLLLSPPFSLLSVASATLSLLPYRYRWWGRLPLVFRAASCSRQLPAVVSDSHHDC